MTELFRAGNTACKDPKHIALFYEDVGSEASATTRRAARTSVEREFSTSCIYFYVPSA